MFGRWIRLIHHYFGHLKWKLFICFVFISVIPAIITGYFLYDRSYEAIEEKISVYSQQIMVQSAGRLDTLLTGIEDISLQMVSSTDIQALVKQIAYTKDAESEALGSTVLMQRLVQILSSKREIVGAQILLTERDLAITSGETMVPADYKSSSRRGCTATFKRLRYTAVVKLRGRALHRLRHPGNERFLAGGILQFAIPYAFCRGRESNAYLR